MTEQKKQTTANAALTSPFAPRLFTSEGKPVRVLSTSLGVALLANAIFSTGVLAANPNNADAQAASAGNEPRLVEWSNEEVKAYFDANVDWSLPLSDAQAQTGGGTDASGEAGAEGTESGSAGGTTVVNHYGGGFGMTELLLFSLLMNRGGAYSATDYHRNRPTYTNNRTPYTPKTYTNERFQNRPVAGSTITPRTSNSTGSITRRSTSSQPGGIGGNSSRLGSSDSGSGSSSASGTRSSGFGG